MPLRSDAAARPVAPRAPVRFLSRTLPAVVAIVVPVVLAVGASQFLLSRTVGRFHAVMDRTVALLLPLSTLRGHLNATALPVEEQLAGVAGAGERLKTAAAQVDADLVNADVLTVLKALDPGPVAAVRREWEAARDAALAAAEGPADARMAAGRAFEAHLQQARSHLDVILGEAIRNLGTEWRRAGDTGSEHLAVAGITALVAVLVALGAGGLILRLAGEVQGVEARYAALTRLDPLTGLENRQELRRRLVEEIARSQRFERPVSVLMLGLDHLGEINAAHGQLAGDLALAAVAAMVSGNVRAIDKVARYGDGSFAAILPETDLGGACVLAERLRRHVADHPAELGEGAPVALTVSIGVAAFPTHAGTPDTLFAAAGEALHRARQEGRNRVEAPVAESPAGV
jgi:diguanylate cyclase (GGDEF)-like protein